MIGSLFTEASRTPPLTHAAVIAYSRRKAQVGPYLIAHTSHFCVCNRSSMQCSPLTAVSLFCVSAILLFTNVKYLKREEPAIQYCEFEL